MLAPEGRPETSAQPDLDCAAFSAPHLNGHEDDVVMGVGLIGPEYPAWTGNVSGESRQVSAKGGGREEVS